jgi:hypothetical protein
MKFIITSTEVKIISNDSNYMLEKGAKVVEINSLSNNEYIEVYADLYDDYHVSKLKI